MGEGAFVLCLGCTVSKGGDVALRSVQVNVHFCVWVGQLGWVGARGGGGVGGGNVCVWGGGGGAVVCCDCIV